VIKEARWSGWVWVGECFFWYRPTRVVPDQRPLNGRCCCCTAGDTTGNSLRRLSFLQHRIYNLLGHATGGARVLIWTCWGLRQRLVATWAEFQHYATDQCWNRLEAWINAEGGHSEHMLWHCLPDIPVATHHNRFFSEPLTTTHNWLLIVYAKQKAFGAIRSITVPRKTVSNFALCSSNSTCEATN